MKDKVSDCFAVNMLLCTKNKTRKHWASFTDIHKSNERDAPTNFVLIILCALRKIILYWKVLFSMRSMPTKAQIKKISKVKNWNISVPYGWGTEVFPLKWQRGCNNQELDVFPCDRDCGSLKNKKGLTFKSMPRKLGKKEGRKRKKDQKKGGRQGLRDQHNSNYIRLMAITGQTSKRKAYGHTQFKIYVYALFVNSDCI